MRNLTDTVKHLIIINVLFFLATAFLPFDLKGLFSMHFPGSQDFQPFQIITNMFMHGDFRHLLFNMLGLYFLGPYVERALGPKRFFILYFGSAFFALFATIGVDYMMFAYHTNGLSSEEIDFLKSDAIFGQRVSEKMVGAARVWHKSLLGASGAVYGVLAGFAAMYPNLKLMLLFPPIPIKAKYMAIGLVVIGLVSGIGGFQEGIGHFAHVGGAVAGFLFIVYWKKLRLR